MALRQRVRIRCRQVIGAGEEMWIAGKRNMCTASLAGPQRPPA